MRVKAAKKTARKNGPRKQSKGAKILELIGRSKGASLAEIMEATGWQAHSVRGFISTAGNKHGLPRIAGKRRRRPRASHDRFDGGRVRRSASAASTSARRAHRALPSPRESTEITTCRTPRRSDCIGVFPFSSRARRQPDLQRHRRSGCRASQESVPRAVPS